MQLFVEGERTRVVQVEEGDAVEELKEKIASSFGVPSEHQNLSFRGCALRDEARLEDCGLIEGSTVKLGLRLRGGKGVLQLLEDSYLDTLELGDRESNLFGVGSLATVEPMCCGPAAGAGAGVEMDTGMDSLSMMDGLDDGMLYFSDVGDVGDFATSTSTVATSAAAAASDQDEHSMVEVSADSAASTAVASPAEPETPEVLTGMSPVETEVDMLPAALIKVKQENVPVPSTAADKREYKGQKGVAFDLDSVDDKLRKRLIKNRLSAERSRQKKNARLTELEEQVAECVRDLQASRAENVELKSENTRLKQENERLTELLKKLSLDGVLDA
mmetsp:Transcript_39615/g.61818  ORF Transcript_39615/g.61818 Transcript_39615/m.61818 type:complete len:331 (+) Transcript_39615:205-1197(+)|eukprot:CAMPEP_0184306428 /NCGR_PEP_ID=MMETSP1049-20130417/15421_1 /TAXON_ID=77928 /ORGANISM="Proteomonas sulcata, Strain CCMP704" /LENGTH=330 /DNA_ID=CAMNT_0026618683 /DNA_START=196 /DNA_END=1188 /DNA_ORIENTATION=-